jgi:hypothetical protein
MKDNRYPPGWNEERVQRVLAHYDAQTEDDAFAEDEAAYEYRTQPPAAVPVELVPAVRELIAKHARRAG